MLARNFLTALLAVMLLHQSAGLVQVQETGGPPTATTPMCGACSFTVVNGTLTRDKDMCDDAMMGTCTVLDLKNQNISSLGFAIDAAAMPQLNTLIISNNPIVNVSGGVFSGFQHLALLEMTDTAVTAIPESFLAMLPMLNTADLKRNAIASIAPMAFHDLPVLNFINLGYNKIEAYAPGTFASLPSLTALDLSYQMPAGSPAPGIPSGTFSDLPMLSFLILEGNMHLTEVPVDYLSHASNLPSLANVVMANTGITCIPETPLRASTTIVGAPNSSSCATKCPAGLFSTVSSYDGTTGACVWSCSPGYVPDASIQGSDPACMPPVPGLVDAGLARNMTFCSPACHGEWVGDGVCHFQCAVPSCGFDFHDCREQGMRDGIRYAAPPILPDGGSYLGGQNIRTALYFATFWVLNQVDTNLDLIISQDEAVAMNITSEDYAHLGDGTFSDVFGLVNAMIRAQEGLSAFEGDEEAVARIMVAMVDGAPPVDNTIPPLPKDSAVDVADAARLGMSPVRFKAFDADGSGKITVSELAASFLDPCRGMTLTTTPPRGAVEGGFKIESDALYLHSPRSCFFLVQPEWFRPAQPEPMKEEGDRKVGGVDYTVSLFTDPPGAPRSPVCLGALVHRRFVATSASCDKVSGKVTWARIGEMDYKVASFFAYKGSPEAGLDFGMAELAGEGAMDVPPVDFLSDDIVQHDRDCSKGFFSIPKLYDPSTSGGGLWQETSPAWNDTLAVTNSTPPMYGWVEEPVAVADHAQCDSALRWATYQGLPSSAEGRVLCASHVLGCEPGEPGGSVPTPGTPLFMRTDPERPPLLVGVAGSQQGYDLCGYHPPTVYTKVAPMQQWARSLSRDFGRFPPRGIKLEFETIDLPMGSTIRVTEAHQDPMSPPVLTVDGGSYACQLEGTETLGKGSVLVEVSLGPVRQPPSCAEAGEGCVGVKVEAKWSEVGCDKFTGRGCEVEGCVSPDVPPMHGDDSTVPMVPTAPAVCEDPKCDIGLDTWGEEMKKLKKDGRLVMGGLGTQRSNTYPTAKTYACVRDWSAEHELQCGARVGEFVCFKHLEEDGEMAPMGGLGKDSIVKKEKREEMARRYRRDMGLHLFADTFSALWEARPAENLWWWWLPGRMPETPYVPPPGSSTTSSASSSTSSTTTSSASASSSTSSTTTSSATTSSYASSSSSSSSAP